jgi:hypothetical protein
MAAARSNDSRASPAEAPSVNQRWGAHRVACRWVPMTYAHEGVNNLRGDPIVPDVSGPEKLIQALGFQPTKIAEQQRINSSKMNYKEALDGRRTSLMNAFAMATLSGDAGYRAASLQKIAGFNRRNPELAIGTNNLRASLRGRQLASRESQNGIRVPPRLAAKLDASVGADDD